jgi:uncharacterized integral membrane protein (TIGR00698 family)
MNRYNGAPLPGSDVMPLFPNAPRAVVVVVLLLLSALIVSGVINSAIALLLGIAMAITFAAPALQLAHRNAGVLLKFAIVLMGLRLPLAALWSTAQTTWLITVLTIALALALGLLLQRWLRLERDTGVLLSVGTAICGGSAIAAVAPVIGARSQAILVAISTVFLLNALALFVFPFIGQWLALTPAQFGLWAALAIHDTSSVVGAAAVFAPDAVAIATTAKLARSLWIIPLVVVIAARTQRQQRLQWPWFIVAFVAASVLRTAVPAIADYTAPLAALAPALFALALFGIGCQFSRTTVQQLSWRPLCQAIILWLALAAFSLLWIIQ